MKFQDQKTMCYGIKQSDVTMDGKNYSSTTFYLPADISESAAGKALGVVTTPHKCGDASEFEKWAHLRNSWPATGLPVLCDFETVAGKNAMGKDEMKLKLLAIRPVPSAQVQKAA